jgi:TatD DNase family protein
MLASAWECRLPVVLHCRGAYADMLPLLEEFYAGKEPAGRFHGVLHCFSGDTADAVRSAGLKLALGVDGPVTYPKNGPLREALTAAGLGRLVLETDSPYLPPQSSRGKRNDPRALPEIAAAVASMFKTDAEAVARATTRNGLDLYRLDESGNKL